MRNFVLMLLFCGLAMLGCKDQGVGENNNVEAASVAVPPAARAQQPPDEENKDDISNSRQNAITRAVAKVSDAVVGINVTQIRESRRGYANDPFFRFFFPERVPLRAVKSLGSGFLMSSDGLIVTNEHVVHNASEIVVALSDGSTANATLVGMDYITDVALIKIDGDNYPYAEIGNSNDVIIGE